MDTLRETLDALVGSPRADEDRAEEESPTEFFALPAPPRRLRGRIVRWRDGVLIVEMIAPSALTWRPTEVWAVLPDGRRVTATFTTPVRAQRTLTPGDHVRLILDVPANAGRPTQLVLGWGGSTQVEITL